MNAIIKINSFSFIFIVQFLFSVNDRQFNQPSESVNPANNELQLYNIMNNLNNPSTVTNYKPHTFADNNNK